MTEENETKPTDASTSGSAVPEYIGPYKIESLLEKGGMSILYLATHPETKEMTVIKVLSPKFLQRPDVIERFLQEAKIIGLPDHSQIVKLYGNGKWEGGLYIAMEFIQGISLRQYLLQTPLSLKRALEIVIDIAYALCHLHTHGVIHRDLKPENILVTETGDIKVIDFGIAQLLTEKPDPDKPARQRLIGTPIYMSPEQRQDPDTVSYSSDIYSLGIIAYELVLGKLCHGQIHLSLMPKGLRKILFNCLQPEPKDRYQDIVDFITDISGYLNSDEMQKEKKVGDMLSELSENMRRVQMTLIPPKPPDWESISIGIANHKGNDFAKFYYDFFEMNGGDYGLILGECSAAGPEGVVYTGVLRGMAKVLCRLTKDPVEVVTLLNDMLVKDVFNQIFNFSYLILSPEKNTFTYLSCGYDNLWHIPNETKIPEKMINTNIALGINEDSPFTEMTKEWNVGDQLVLNTFSTTSFSSDKEVAFPDALFQQALKENAHLPSKKQVETLLHKMKTVAVKLLKDRSLAIISMQRN